VRSILVKSFLVLGSVGFVGTAHAVDSPTSAARRSPAAVAMSGTQEASEEARIVDMLEAYAPLARYLSEATGVEIKLGYSRNMTEELQRTRTGSVGILLGPAHVIGSALRYGFEPVGTFSGSEKMAFVVAEGSAINSLDDAKGKRLGLPSPDSLATYLALGEFNSKGIHVKSYFGQVTNYKSHEVTLYAMTMGAVDVAVVEYGLAQKWLSANKGRIVYETKSVPSSGIAVNSALDPKIRQKIRDALLSPNPKRPSYAKLASVGITKVASATEADYRYVSTLGYFTPTVLSGISIVTAEEVVDLRNKGVPLYDVRIDREYQEKHIKGAISLPYGEKSKKEVGFDASPDTFKLTDVVKDKNAPIIFACNGEECWKSYKASVWAQKQGYKNIYWFRGGFPAWKEKNLPLE
jgi:ABC-type phosphate/phosphonate transport system substrate-binding protein/rhodanese-related sulfurtransferase